MKIRQEREELKVVKKKISRAHTREIVGSIMNTIMAQTSNKSPDSSKIMENVRQNANKHMVDSHWQ